MAPAFDGLLGLPSKVALMHILPTLCGGPTERLFVLSGPSIPSAVRSAVLSCKKKRACCCNHA